MSSLSTYPATIPHRIVTFPERARTEPASRGFMRLATRRHKVDDEGITMPTIPEKKITQEEQDAIDEEARKRATRNLVDSWQERLQLISVITTFFASTEAAVLVNTKPVNSNDLANSVLNASNASLLGALILHVYAAILSFLGAFFLIRYKLKEATREELLAKGLVISPLSGSVFNDHRGNPTDLGTQQTSANVNDVQFTSHNGPAGPAPSAPVRNKESLYSIEPPIFSRDPHLELVGPFRFNVSSHLLSRTHTLCVSLAALGFVLAIVGILCYAWASQPRGVSIFASTCLGGAVLVMVLLFI